MFYFVCVPLTFIQVFYIKVSIVCLCEQNFMMFTFDLSL